MCRLLGPLMFPSRPLSVHLAFVFVFPGYSHGSTPFPFTQTLAQVLVNGVAASPSPLPLNQLRISSPVSPGMYFVAIHECAQLQRDCVSTATCGATFVVE